MAAKTKRLGILVAGGPAPGINSVIGAATICARLLGAEVMGILDGFKWLMKGDTSKCIPLEIGDVSRIHFKGGSHIGISRANPTKREEDLNTVVKTLLSQNIHYLITIGGDDTLFTASHILRHSQGQIGVVHVPKTIDNDLELPHGFSTFGFQTARHMGVQLIKNLMNDALTTHRWYFAVTMGRQAGHLALGIGKATGATITIIPEEFGDEKVTLREIVDTLVGAIIKRLADGRPDGVAILAEGLVEKMDPMEFETLKHVERDQHGHIRLSEISIGEMIKLGVKQALEELGIHSNIITKDIGYELRCADPIPFDMAYTRDLGFLAAQHVLHGGTGKMITIQSMMFKPVPFEDMIDPITGKSRIRMVPIVSDTYKIAYAYMLRLKRADFHDSKLLAKYAKTANMNMDQFKARFEYLVNRPVHDIDIRQQPIEEDTAIRKLKK